MQEFILNVKSFFLFRILVDTKEKLLPLLLLELLRINLLLQIFIFIALPLTSLHCVSAILFSCPFLLGEKNITLNISCSGRAVFCFILFCQSLGISFKISR